MIRLFRLRFVTAVVSLLITSLTAHAQQNWQWLNMLPASIGWKGAAFGNGLYVLVGNNGTLATSPDAITWTLRRALTTEANLNSVTFANGRFVAVGTNSGPRIGSALILTSTDGLTWTKNDTVASTLSAQLQGVAFGNNTWVVTGASSSRILTSADGLNWTLRTLTATTGRIAFGGGQFVALTNNNRAVVSNDGINWTTVSLSSATSAFYEGVTYGAGRFVAAGRNSNFKGSVATSTDGTNWTVTEIADNDNGASWVAFGNNAFILSGNGGLFSSPDGTTWTKRTSPMPPTRASATNSLSTELFGPVGAANNTLFVFGIYGTIATSTDGATWTRRSSGTAHDINGLVHDGTRFVGVGTGGTVVTSTNGTTWTATSTNQTGWFGKLAYANGVYAAAGLNGLYTSTDLATWTNRGNTSFNQMWGVIHAGERFVAANNGISTGLLVSTDGTTWNTIRIPGASGTVQGLTWGGGLYLVTVGGFGSTPKIYTSPDAATWTDRTPAGFTTPESAAYANGRFVVLTGTASWTSTDASSWTSAPLAKSYRTVFGLGDTFVARDGYSCVISSNGTTWTPVDNSFTGIVVVSTMLVKDDKVYAVGGGGAILRGDLATATTPPPPAASNAGRLINMSIRTTAGTGDNTLIVGVALGGANTGGDKAVLIRGVGPTLSSFGVGGALNDSVMTIFQGNTQVAQNDDWAGTFNFNSVGAFAFAGTPPRDAAIYSADTASGSYSIQITGKNNATGIALAEIYDATPAASFAATTPRLINVSARAQVGTGDNILIAGFVVGGTSPIRVLIRAVGPTLGRFGVDGTLADPKLEVFDGSTRKAENDNWGGTAELKTAGTSVGAFALSADNSRDAAVVTSLPPGTYTAQVSGVGNTTGVALVEVYELP